MTAPAQPNHLVSFEDILPWASIISGYRQAGADSRVLEPEYRLRSLILVADMCHNPQPTRAIWRMVRREFPNLLQERECDTRLCHETAYYWPGWWGDAPPLYIYCPACVAGYAAAQSWCPIHRVALSAGDDWCNYGGHGGGRCAACGETPCARSTYQCAGGLAVAGHACDDPPSCPACNVDTILDFEYERARLGK